MTEASEKVSSRGSQSIPQYSLNGPQVEPEASYWIRCPRPKIVSLDELIAVTDDPRSNEFFPPYPDWRTPEGQNVTDAEIAELRELATLRADQNAVAGGPSGRERKPLSVFLTGGTFLNMKFSPPPLGAVVRTARPNEPLIQTGRELARYFEKETPGLAHRHALNGLILLRNWSPPRQAWVWAALDVAISSALLAAWHYKWLSTGRTDLVARRQRPIEYLLSRGLPPLEVLYDTEVDVSSGEVRDGRPRTEPQPSPGTPRHPAYPSGHSTYAGAASELLSCFFPEARTELDNLADNAGMARLWAGIHWRTDHIAGMALGRTVARLVVTQLNSTGIPPIPNSYSTPPSLEVLQRQADKFAVDCGRGNSNFCSQGERLDAEMLRRAQSPQQGAR
ncbi:vanadium-dependent haloperoxidase [Nostoc sp.]|uniref:vanadium-dependent haloperoxidase n=1 Tax=Nostoc sp. TaxID=1180 RepID=UPI0035944F7F